jgi:hypothetical protein
LAALSGSWWIAELAPQNPIHRGSGLARLVMQLTGDPLALGLLSRYDLV